MAYVKRYKWWMAFSIVSGFGRLILPLYMPLFVKAVIDKVLKAQGMGYPERMHLLWSMMPPLLAILVVHVAATVGRVYGTQVAGSNAVRDFRHQLFDHVQRLSLEFHNQRPTGSIVSRLMSDVATAQSAFDLLLVQAGQQILQFIVIAIYLLVSDYQWALVSFAALPIFGATTTLMKDQVRLASRQVLETSSRISGHMTERMSMVREIQSFTQEDYESNRIHRQVRVLKGYTLRQFWLGSMLLASSEITRTVGLVVMLIFGVHRVLNGYATVGDVTAFYLYVTMLLQPIDWLSNFYPALQSTGVSADRLFEYMDARTQVADVRGATTLSVRRPPSVRFDDVTFAYPDEPHKKVLKNISFEAEPGWQVVLVGSSGSGKSSLMNLLLRFYNVESGKITIDDKDIAKVTTHSLRSIAGIVPQQPMLFRGTVRDNILYGRRGAREAELRAAARAANADDFISALPHGYDTHVGERGTGLSGGQIQRIAIARAFLKDPSVLIMDEATSNLDAESESLVLEALERLAAGRTTFIIAHRLSVARTADLILVMHEGKIIERGVHTELLESDTFYRNLWQQQMEGVPREA